MVDKIDNEEKRIYSIYTPKEFVKKPAHYLLYSSAIRRVDKLIRDVVPLFPEEYRNSFEMRSYEWGDMTVLGKTNNVRGSVSYANFSLSDEPFPFRICLTSDAIYVKDCLHGQNKQSSILCRGMLNVSFSFLDKGLAARLLNAFDYAFEPFVDNELNPQICLIDTKRRKIVSKGYDVFVSVFDGTDIPIFGSPLSLENLSF